MPSRKRDRRESEQAVNEDRRGADRRQSHRILVDLEVDYQCEDTFLFAYITDMSAFGIFIRTNNPEPPGTHLNLRFRLPEDDTTMALEGEVIWINAFRPGDFNNLNPGMGVRFTELTDDQKGKLMDLIRKVAYLEDDEEDEDDEYGEDEDGEEQDEDEQDGDEEDEDGDDDDEPVASDKN
jgi:uncharacterized protein (TIGR02266 family)